MTGWAITSFSRRVLLNEVSYLLNILNNVLTNKSGKVKYVPEYTVSICVLYIF